MKTISVKLSNGTVIQVRPFTAEDFKGTTISEEFEARGILPKLLANSGSEESRALIRQNFDLYLRQAELAALRCVVTPDFKIVNKPENECAEDELPLEIISLVDLLAILAGACGGLPQHN